MNKSPIPSAGPWITDKEISYVTDAVTNGWYSNWSSYLDRFEETFAQYVGVKHAIATSSCTGALHIALRALDIKEGDEVIVPEVTWVATATCVSYLNATPVFADVEADTWCIDPEAVRNAITRKTKAIIAVDMYGHPSSKSELQSIANEYGLALVEDAAPGLGSKYNGKMVGSFGTAGCFSFQGAKPLVCGEGGMLVTDDSDYYERCRYYWDHCREPGEVLYNTDIGFKYKLSNIQAALGLGQLERADEIIGKRRQIYFWYRDRLADLDGIQLNVERDGCYNNFYVPTIVFAEGSSNKAQELMSYLNEMEIGNRPFFRSLSKLPMFTPAKTPVADWLSSHGVNLPCATKMTEAEVDYVCECIRAKLVGSKRAVA